MTDKATDTLIRDVPLGGGNFAKIPEPQRLVFGSVRWAFDPVRLDAGRPPRLARLGGSGAGDRARLRARA